MHTQESELRHGRHLRENMNADVETEIEVEEVTEGFWHYFFRVWARRTAVLIIIAFCLGFGLTYWDLVKTDYYERRYTYDYYTVGTGDTINSIAERFSKGNKDMIIEIIYDRNPDIPYSGTLYEGQRILVPVK